MGAAQNTPARPTKKQNDLVAPRATDPRGASKIVVFPEVLAQSVQNLVSIPCASRIYHQ